MSQSAPEKIYLKDYREPSHWIRKTHLLFDIHDGHTLVTSNLTIETNTSIESDCLVLDGQDLELVDVCLDGRPLSASEYHVNEDSLSLKGLSGKHELHIVTKILPHQNTSLEGLYRSRLMFCTQCEAEGFRKITYYLDRPDVMSEFTTRIQADASQYPVLLSNGNQTDRGVLPEGRHWVEWHDPHLKPCYLFALVAGSLSHIDDQFITASGREVLLRIFVEKKDLDKCAHAIESLKNAMRWDEEVYGREYDLDIFMIVAVDDFNMGAMENKGLNIFNTSCVLAHPSTTTDAEFQRVEGVVAHEYFHNWSGNRVTCRDWFQLSLKEGFTVFRDAEFSADMGSKTVKRVEDVSLLKSLQFAEDGGPMAHAVRPASFIEISNFYTLTIYEKGAEVVRMIRTLLGEEVFRQGSDLYFERHDACAVTIEDFVSAMADVSGRDFSQFMNWYSQAGTPELYLSTHYDSDAKTYSMTFRQSCRPTAECDEKQPFLIPIKMALIGKTGLLPLQLDGHFLDRECVLEFMEKEKTFVFTELYEEPVPSLLREFSAPVKLKYRYAEHDLSRVMRLDDDGFSRWEASQQLAINEIQRVMAKLSDEPSPAVSENFIAAYREVLLDECLDKAMLALMLTLPSEKYLGELAITIDVELIHFARKCVERKLAQKLKTEWAVLYRALESGNEPYSSSAESVARRSLKNKALHYIALSGSDEALTVIQNQLTKAENMTDELAAFRALVHSTKPSWQEAKALAISSFYSKWKEEALVVNHWFSVQATQPQPDVLKVVESLMQHEAFEYKNPNKLRALIGTFCNANSVNFHASNGGGYRFLADQIIRLNQANPQIAARMLTPLTKWKRYDENRGGLMRAEVERIRKTEQLSKDVFEVVEKILNA